MAFQVKKPCEHKSWFISNSECYSAYWAASHTFWLLWCKYGGQTDVDWYHLEQTLTSTQPTKGNMKQSRRAVVQSPMTVKRGKAALFLSESLQSPDIVPCECQSLGGSNMQRCFPPTHAHSPPPDFKKKIIWYPQEELEHFFLGEKHLWPYLLCQWGKHLSRYTSIARQ